MFGSKIESNKTQLIDRFGRAHNYLRLSITDQCNFACSYCKPENKHCQASNPIMSAEEVVELAKAFVKHGVNKIRLTGGEPLVRPDFDKIIPKLGKLPVDLAITTNGYLLDRHFNLLKTAGVKKLNISLDTLKEERFNSITQRNAFHRVFSNLILAIKLGFEVKLNAVIMRGTNEDEIVDFARLTQKYPLSVRFIEFMPFKDNDWNFGKTFSKIEMINLLSQKFNLNAEEKVEGQTAEYYRIPKAQGKVGIISTLSHPFCGSCNRIRVMADGKLKNCLFGSSEYDLIAPFRKGENISEYIHSALVQKHEQHGGNKPFTGKSTDHFDNRNMYSIGG